MLAIPGEDLGWMAVLRVVFEDPEQLEKVTKLIAWKKNLPEDKTHYLPPSNFKGKAQGAELVSDGVIVEEVGESAAAMNKQTGTNNSCNPNESVNNSSHRSNNVKVIELPEEVTIEGVINQKIEETRVEEVEEVLGGRDESLILAENLW